MTIVAILKDDSLTDFDTAMVDAWVDPDPGDKDDPTPLVMTQEHIEKSLCAVTMVVIPFCALKTQKAADDRIDEKAI